MKNGKEDEAFGEAALMRAIAIARVVIDGCFKARLAKGYWGLGIESKGADALTIFYETVRYSKSNQSCHLIFTRRKPFLSNGVYAPKIAPINN